jgi:glucosylceramidase
MPVLPDLRHRLLAAACAIGACSAIAQAVPVSIRIDPSQRFQQMEGFGASLTESSASLITTAMSPAQRSALMQTLFNRNTGGGLSFLRQPMGSSDFALSNYSYNDIPTGQADYALAQFSIARDQQTIVPLLQQARALNLSLRLMGTPWSPPAWMKTTGQVHGGHLKDSTSIYESYANYFVKYAQAYEAAGLPIDYVSMQNEPWYETQSYPSMRMEPAEQARLIKLVGPKFAAAGIGTKVLGWDHNWGEAGQFVPQLMADTEAAAYIDGIAFHGYSGNVSAQTAIRNLYPDKGIFFTEVTSTLANTNFAGDLMWDMQNLIVGGPRNWSKSVVRWNLALDQNGNPKQSGAPAGMRGLVTINSNTGQVTLNGEYYSLAHLSKFVVPGAYRVASDDEKSVAFVNPDGSDAVVAYNDAGAPKDVVLRWKGRMMPYRLPALSVATFAWDGVTGTGVQVWLTTGDRSKLLARQADATFATTTWTANKIADWNAAANWSIAVPNGVDDQAMLGASITAARTIYADDPVTLGTLRFNNANTYVLAGSANLTMQVSEGSALIEARAGTQKINLPLTLASDTTLSALAGATLVIADPLTIRPGVTVTQTGGGTVSYLSTIQVPAGARVAFGGGGASVASLVLAPGSSAGAAEVGRSFVSVDRLSIAAGAQFELGGSVLALANTSPGELDALLDSDRIVSRAVADSGGGALIVTLDASALAAARFPSVDPRFLSFPTGSIAVSAYLGDVNLDGTVTAQDLQIMMDHFGEQPATDVAWLFGDMNGDGIVNGIDQQATTANLGMTVVPEPALLAVALAAGALTLRHRRVAKRRMIVGTRHVSPETDG